MASGHKVVGTEPVVDRRVTAFRHSCCGETVNVVLESRPVVVDEQITTASWLQGVTAATQHQDLVIIPLEFNQGIAAFSSPSESEFGAAIAEQMQTLIDNGAWASEFAASFTFSPPWTIEEMAASG